MTERFSHVRPTNDGGTIARWNTPCCFISLVAWHVGTVQPSRNLFRAKLRPETDEKITILVTGTIKIYCITDFAISCRLYVHGDR